MNTDRELMQQALDALEVLVEIVVDDLGYDGYQDKTIENLRARLAQPEPPCKTGSQCIGGKCTQCVDEPEPVAWILMNGYLVRHENIHLFDTHDAVPLYTSPLQRPWVGLTDEEIIPDGENVVLSYSGLIKFARAIEAKLKAKNGF